MRQTANIMTPALEDVMQKRLTPDQLEAFYHNEFVTSQITHFNEMLGGWRYGSCSFAMADVKVIC